MTGIYCIRNTIDNKVYVGSSCDIENRWKNHIWLLKNGFHHSSHLQNAWNKYDSNSFSFEILEELSDNKEVLISREQYWIDKFASYNPENGYNIMQRAGGNHKPPKRQLLSKDQLIDLLIYQHLTCKAVSNILMVTEKTVRRYARRYDINPFDWWKYQQICCSRCGKEMDPKISLDKKNRIQLINKTNRLCDNCKLDIRREKDRNRKRKERAKNRESYNEYQRNLMRDLRKKKI